VIKDKDGNVPPASPVDEYEFGTKLFTHDGTEWVLDVDQSGRPDHLTLYGLPVAGDLFGPWNLNDIQTALNDQVWTWTGSSGGGVATASSGVVQWGWKSTLYAAHWETEEEESTYEEAVAGLEAAWYETATPILSALSNVYLNGEVDSGGPFATYALNGAYLEADAEKQTAIPVLDRLPTHCSKTILLYVFGDSGAIPGTWEPSDSGITTPDEWTLLETTGPTAAGEIEMTEIGDPDVVPDPPTGMDLFAGFTISAAFYLIKWDVVGGFAYVAP
jgi:hypothetical protein